MLRSATALAAGLAREIGAVALPVSLRRTRLYQSLVDNTLRFLIEQVGEVEGSYPSEGKLAEDFLLRRTAGNGIEMIGILTFHASPVWVMAALADLSGAGRQLIVEITSTLQKEGLLDPGATFETVEQMLDGLEKSAGRAAEAFNTPPLDVAGLRSEWDAIRREAATIPAPNLPSAADLWNGWRELQQQAAAQGRTVFEVSSLIALSTMTALPGKLRWFGKSAILAARRTGEIVAGSLLQHYASALAEIQTAGYLAYWVRQYRPYLRAAVAQFSTRRGSLTQRFLRKSE
ncbi:MAG TPA: hypothetical protein VMZ52_17130 [Bryobacteraceae bacterium]|nr:hypothetical protein [Bryobacteraceae bacterium]